MTVVFASCLIILATVELALYVWRTQKLKTAYRLLRLAKQEAQEIAQLPLNNPHPLIQISEGGTIIFANSEAFRKFPDIKRLGIAHPILSGIISIISTDKETSREVSFEGHVYRQSITPTKVNDQNAFIVYCHDITDHKKYEEDLKKLNQKAENSRIAAERANQARGDFLANMSHELRTPMNGIIGLSDILVESPMDPKHKELIEAINSSAQNLLILLNDILDFSKIEAGELSIEKIPFDLHQTVQHIEKLQKPIAVKKNLALEVSCSGNLPPCLIGDPARLQQILNNLVNNALKFTENGTISVSIDGQSDGSKNFITRITVSDTGIGIPKDKQAKLFQKFQQADSSTARKYGGTGLGLAITKNLTELMGGAITLQSQEGKGTTFTLSIPFGVAESESPLLQTQESQPPAPSHTIDTEARILIVDDHPVNLLFMRQIMHNFGFRNFDEASSGKEAISLFQERHHDLIFMDCQMPEMDGFEAVRKIREMEGMEPKTVIIAVTANAMSGAAEKCNAAGMDDYISKPVNKTHLRNLLQKWLHLENLPSAGQKVEEPMAPPPPHEGIVLDENWLNDMLQGDEKAKENIINIYLKKSQVDLAILEKSAQINDYNSWAQASHKLYGSSANIGAVALANICDRAQNLQASESEEMKTLYPAILHEYKRVRVMLTKSGS